MVPFDIVPLVDLVLVPIPRFPAILLQIGVALMKSRWNQSANVNPNTLATDATFALTTTLATPKFPVVHANPAIAVSIGTLKTKATVTPRPEYVSNVCTIRMETIVNSVKQDIMETPSMIIVRNAFATCWVRIPTSLTAIGPPEIAIVWPMLKAKVATGALRTIGASPEAKVARHANVTWSVPCRKLVMNSMVNANVSLDLEDENVTNARRITMEIRKSNAFLVIATREFQNPCNAIALRENVSVVKVKLSIFHVPFFPKVQIFHSFQDFEINNSN